MPEQTEMKYCPYCRKQTPHRVVDSRTDGKGTGRDLRCTKAAQLVSVKYRASTQA